MWCLVVLVTIGNWLERSKANVFLADATHSALFQVQGNTNVLQSPCEVSLARSRLVYSDRLGREDSPSSVSPSSVSPSSVADSAELS